MRFEENLPVAKEMLRVYGWTNIDTEFEFPEYKIDLPFWAQILAAGAYVWFAYWLLERVNIHLSLGVEKVIKEDLNKEDFTSLFKLIPSIFKRENK